jgi:cell fate regulator YaaT (PSP1 superfamily)
MTMQTVRIRLRKPTRVFTFLSRDVPLKRDDACVVRSDRGLEYGTCVTAPEECPEGLEKRLKMTVVRKATLNDESSFRQIQIDEERAKQVCAQKISQHNLPMKLVDVEYTFDKHKVVFYFTAAERVDFRRLVRDLAQSLRTRIELRHIQVRDEAKLIGGLGMCGRSLCCSTWLREFHPISMKMAKRQNLSLNPSKISGQCGRLLCCLGYEDDLYPKKKKAKPKTDEAPAVETTPEKEEPAEAVTPEVKQDGAMLDLIVPGDFGRAVEDHGDGDKPPSSVVEGFGAKNPEKTPPPESPRPEPPERAAQPPKNEAGEPKKKSSRRRRRRRRSRSKRSSSGNTGS